MTSHTLRTHGRLRVAALLLVVACLHCTVAVDPCLSKPWQLDGLPTAPAPTVVTVSSFDELQEHIDAAVGPATFVLKSTQAHLVANQPLHINKSSITIAASLDWLKHADTKSSRPPPAHLEVACSSTTGSLLQGVHVNGLQLIGLQISHCEHSAIQLVSAKKVLLRGCLFHANSNATSGGALDALRSQVWVDRCTFEANIAVAGSGGAISAIFSHLLVTDSEFSSNSAGVSGGAVALRGRSQDASAAAAAGGVCWRDMDAFFIGTTWVSNRAKLHGGAVAMNGSHAIMQAVVGSSNKARYGGVVYQGQTAQLVVRGGSFMENNTATSSGGVVYAVSPGAHLFLSNSSFSNNQAKILGGVVSAKEAASVRLDSCVFNNNTADLAAGVLYARDADVSASSCTFTTNSAKRDGGALYCAGGCVWNLQLCTFRDNECGANGGALFGWNVEASVSNSTLDANSAGVLGGGVAVANSTLELTACQLGFNNAYGSDAAGGGLYSQGSILNLTNCDMVGNVASWGGAVYITNSTLSLTGGGISNSSATGSGAAMYVLRSGVAVTNTTMAYNHAQQYGGSMYCSDSSCSCAGCDILGDSAVQGGGCFWVGRGSLSMRRTHIAGCVSATDNGGAVHASAAVSVTASGCSFNGCSALRGSGGALWLHGVQSVSIRGSLLAKNQAKYGGSLFISNSTASISSSSIINCTATVGGGIASIANSDLTLTNSTAVAGNMAAVGGGVAIDSTRLTLSGPSVTISWNKAQRPAPASTAAVAPVDADISGPSSQASAVISASAVFGSQAVLRGLGGGLYAHNSRVLASELRLERNIADRVGAGAYMDRCGVKIARSNISRNHAAEQAGGLKLLNTAQGSALLDVVVSSNWAGLKGGGLALVGVDLASEVALVNVALVNNSAPGQAGGGLWLSGPLGLLMMGGKVSGNTAGTSAAATPSSSRSVGSSSDARMETAGGGMLLEDCSWAALHGVDVLGNAALAGCGGGIALSGCGKFLLSGSTLLGNVAGSGGGLCASDMLSFLTLLNSTVSSNRVLLGGLWDASMATTTVALSPTSEPHLNCGVQGTGGGLCISSLGEVLINGSTISKNQARNGGAMALGLCGDGDKCNLGLVEASFLNNTAVQGGGGAVYFNTAVSPQQVRCGEDYNASSSITAYARSTSFPSLDSLLASAAFLSSNPAGGSTSSNATGPSGSGTPPDAPGGSGAGSSNGGSSSAGINAGVDTVNPPSPAGSTGGSTGAEDDILASTPGSRGTVGDTNGANSGSSTGASDPQSNSSPETFDSVGAGGSSSPATTTVNFGTNEGPTDAQLAGMDPAALSAPVASGAAAPAGSAQTESALVGQGAATPAPAPSSAQRAASKGSSSGSSGSLGATGSSKSSRSSDAEDDDIQASTPGYIPPGMFTIASVPESRPSVRGMGSSSLAAYQARSAGITAGLQQQQQGNGSVSVAAVASAPSSSQQKAVEAQLPDATTDGTALAAVTGASAADRGDEATGRSAEADKLDWELRDASEGLRVMPGPQHLGSGQAAPPAEADALLAAAQTAAAATRAAGRVVGSSNASLRLSVGAASAQLQRQQALGQQAYPDTWVGASSGQLSEAAARSVPVPVTLQVLQAAEKAGMHPKVTTAWQRIGTVTLGELLDAGVVDDSLLSEFLRSSALNKGAGSHDAVSSSSRLTGWQQQFYAQLAALLVRAAAKQAGLVAGVEDRGALVTPGPRQGLVAPCDPVQNPAACPVPDASQALGVQATSSSGAATAMPKDSSSSSSSTAWGRRLAQIEDLVTAAEEASTNMTFMSTDLKTVGTAAQPDAVSSGFILQGTSQCGVFVDNTAIGMNAYGASVTSRPAGLRVWGALTGNDSSSIPIATGGQLQVQVSVVDVFGGIVTSGAADFIRIQATLAPPSAFTTTTKSKNTELLTGPGLARAIVGREVDDNGVELSGLQQLSTSNGSLILSGLQLSGLPGTNTTLYITASDPTLLPASLPITLTSCSAGYMQLPGQCQLCPVGTFSFTPDEPLCSLCPVGASCNGTLLVPLAGYWQSSPRSAQVHACLNPAACQRDALRQQQLADWQATHYGRGAIVGKSKEALAMELEQYMADQCVSGYSGRMCGVCTQEPAAVVANHLSHGMVGGACVACGDHKTAVGMFALVRVFDLALWAVLTFVACKAASAWAQAISLNVSVAAATAGSLPPASAASGSHSRRTGSKGDLVLASSAAAAAAAAEVPVMACLHAHVGVFLDYLQLLSIISASAASYAWPKLLKTFMASFAFVPLGTSRWVSAECLLPYRLSYRHSIVGLLLTAALPLLYLLSSAAVWIMGLLRGKTHRTAIMALVVGTGLFYPLITMSALSVFSCHTLDDTKVAVPGEQLSAVGSYWTLDPELKCYTGQHLQLTLGFGLPVVLLVVFAWPLLLASMLWDSRFRIRDQQLHPATRRRYLVRKTVKMCHQILGVMSGFVRPKFYLWPVVVEVRKLLLCVVVVLVAGSPGPVQLYVLWGLVAVMLVIEWWARPGANWPIVGLQLVALGAVQAVVYLASAFTQISLVGSAGTFTGLIMVMCCMVVVACVLSLLAAFRSNTWLTQLLDVDKDGKVSRQDLAVSASKLMHWAHHHGGKGSSSDDSPGAPGHSLGCSGSDSSNRSSFWKGTVLLFSKRRLGSPAAGQVSAAAATGASIVQQGADESLTTDQVTTDQSAAGAGNGRLTPSSRSPCLVASSLPLAHAAAGRAGAAAPRDTGVPSSSSIDMGMLAMLQRTNAAGSAHNAAGLSTAEAGQSSGQLAHPYIAVDLQHLSQSSAIHPGPSQQQSSAALVGRANSVGLPGRSERRMPLHTYMSVQQWIEQSGVVTAALGHVDKSGPATGDGSGKASLIKNSRSRSCSLQLSASTPAPQVAVLRSSSGSLALQRAQLLQQCQQQVGGFDEEGVQAPPMEGGHLHTLHSVSENGAQEQQQQQRRRNTGPAAAARAKELAAASSVQQEPSGQQVASQCGSACAPAVRHQPYYALWSSIASDITGPIGSVDSSARPPTAPSGHSSSRGSERQQASSHGSSSSRRGVAAASSSGTRSSYGTRGTHSSGFVTGSIGSSSQSSSSSRVRLSPFAASAAAMGSVTSKVSTMRQPPFAVAGGAAGSAGLSAVRAASAPDAHAAAAALAAAAAGAPSVAKGRHSSYYSMWQTAIEEASGDATDAAQQLRSAGASACSQRQQQALPVMTAGSAATAPPVVLEPRRHKQYIGLWSALADELGDGPSAVGAAAPGPVVPAEVAAAFAAAITRPGSVAEPATASGSAGYPTAQQTSHTTSTSSIQSAQQQLLGRVRPSPFASVSAVAAVLQAEETGHAAAAQQQEPTGGRRRRRPGRRPRDSAGTCLGTDSE